jgi:hypothetical protein
MIVPLQTAENRENKDNMRFVLKVKFEKPDLEYVFISICVCG